VTLDAALFAIDARFGLSALAVARSIDSRPWLTSLLALGYDHSVVAIAIIWSIERNLALRRAWIIGSALVLVCYQFVPACGPAWLFSNFPWTATQQAIDPFAWRNCFPSMHISWPLLALLNTRSRALKGGIAAYLTLTAMATITAGQHYFVDLAAAIPFCLLVQRVTHAEWRRSAPVGSSVRV
jgi:PAP2 superfamily